MLKYAKMLQEIKQRREQRTGKRVTKKKMAREFNVCPTTMGGWIRGEVCPQKKYRSVIKETRDRVRAIDKRIEEERDRAKRLKISNNRSFESNPNIEITTSLENNYNSDLDHKIDYRIINNVLERQKLKWWEEEGKTAFLQWLDNKF